MLKKLDQMAGLCETTSCRRKYLLNYFGEEAASQCGNCDVCNNDYEKKDATIEAQKILSAVARLQQRFGTNYVVEFLRGGKTVKPEHQHLKTFGIGKDVSKDQWKIYIRQLVQLDYLQQSSGEYPVLQLTEASARVLKGEEKVELMRPVHVKKEPLKKPEQILSVSSHPMLLKELKELRYELSVQENVPAYLIFSDATLMELSNYLPLSEKDLSKITGFGDVKLAKYGAPFLNVLRTYCSDNNLVSLIDKKTVTSAKQRSQKEKPGDTKRQTLEMFRQGNTILEIAALRNLSVGTIEGHLAFGVYTGELDILELVPSVKYDAIMEAIRKTGGHAASPIKELLGEDYSYGEIRAVMNHTQRLKDGAEAI